MLSSLLLDPGNKGKEAAKHGERENGRQDMMRVVIPRYGRRH